VPQFFARCLDYLKAQRSMILQMDSRTLKLNLKNMTRPANWYLYAQTLGKDVSLHGLNSVHQIEHYHDLFMEILEPDHYPLLMRCLPTLPDTPRLEWVMDRGVELAANNTKALTDGIILQSGKFREIVEAAVEQAEPLLLSRNPADILRGQQTFRGYIRQALTEQCWVIGGLLANVIDDYTRLLTRLYRLPVKK